MFELIKDPVNICNLVEISQVISDHVNVANWNTIRAAVRVLQVIVYNPFSQTIWIVENVRFVDDNLIGDQDKSSKGYSMEEFQWN